MGGSRRSHGTWRVSQGALVASVLGALVLVLPSGSAGSAAAGACGYPNKRSCVYDIEFVAESRDPRIGVFGLTARFRRVTIHHTQNPTFPARNPLSLSISNGGPNGRMRRTVIGSLDIRGGGCVHKRTYQAAAQGDFDANIRLAKAGGREEMNLELAPPRIIPPNWACSLYVQQNLDLARVMSGVGSGQPVTSPAATWGVAVGNDPSFGAASLAAQYLYFTKRRQVSEGSLSSPYRELWAGRSVVVRQRFVRDDKRVTTVRLQFTRR